MVDNWIKEQILQSELVNFNDIVNETIALVEASKIESCELSDSQDLIWMAIWQPLELSPACQRTYFFSKMAIPDLRGENQSALLGNVGKNLN